MIVLEQLTKGFRFHGTDVTAVDRVDLNVGTGEICVLIGPSGCGKTTTLKMVNRLVKPDSGRILLDGIDTSGLDSATLARGIGYVIQQVGLFPNMTVEQNICIVPRLLAWRPDEKRQRAHELLDMMGLDKEVFLGRYPHELSGGQAQRVGVARALAADPPIMLMDEPFGALDPINREALQDEFLRMQKRLRKTILFVSHDIDEAVKMADRIAIFRGGRIEQVGTPDEILTRPASEFVAQFIGRDRSLKRMRCIKCVDAMKPNPLRVSMSSSVDEARNAMDQAGAAFALVDDSTGRPIGLLDRADLASGAARCEHAALPLGPSVNVDDDLRTVLSEMLGSGRDWLACTDDEGRVIGIVTQADVWRILKSPAEGRVA
jgi:osmoprotectant transport system ATP-binding protein